MQKLSITQIDLWLDTLEEISKEEKRLLDNK